MGAQPQRHDFHGDVVEESTDNPNALRTWPGQTVVFCAKCDMFEPADVVRAHPPEVRIGVAGGSAAADSARWLPGRPATAIEAGHAGWAG